MAVQNPQASPNAKQVVDVFPFIVPWLAVTAEGWFGAGERDLNVELMKKVNSFEDLG